MENCSKCGADFDPDKVPAFSHRKELGNGIVVYWVEDSKDGMRAVRAAVDAAWGKDENSWCLVSRKANFDEEEAEYFNDDEDVSDLTKEKLACAWRHWQTYDAYQKRVAFKDGKLLGFSANSYKGKLYWCDRYGVASDFLEGVFDQEGYELAGDMEGMEKDPCNNRTANKH